MAGDSGARRCVRREARDRVLGRDDRTVANPCIRIIRAEMMMISPCCSMDNEKYFFENSAKIKSIKETPRKIVLQDNCQFHRFLSHKSQFSDNHRTSSFHEYTQQ